MVIAKGATNQLFSVEDIFYFWLADKDGLAASSGLAVAACEGKRAPGFKVGFWGRVGGGFGLAQI